MKPSLRVNAYSAGERFQILELCLLHLIKKGERQPGVDFRLKLGADLNSLLAKHGVMGLSTWGRTANTHSIPFSQLLANLEDTGFTGTGPVGLAVSKKGLAYMRRCPKRIRMAAAKISCDVLDLIVEATR